jgi:hypothetical protein
MHAAARQLISRGPWFSTVRKSVRAASFEKRTGREPSRREGDFPDISGFMLDLGQ